MKVYTTDKIRNVALLGHGGSGKTSLAESMAFLAGKISRPGKVADGNTISDYDKQEVKRQISIQTSVLPIEWGENKINILDTPGSLDFIGETEEALSAADAAIIVVSGKNGIESGTKRAWELCDKHHRYSSDRTGLQSARHYCCNLFLQELQLVVLQIAEQHYPV